MAKKRSSLRLFIGIVVTLIVLFAIAFFSQSKSSHSSSTIQTTQNTTTTLRPVLVMSTYHNVTIIQGTVQNYFLAFVPNVSRSKPADISFLFSNSVMIPTCFSGSADIEGYDMLEYSLGPTTAPINYSSTQTYLAVYNTNVTPVCAPYSPGGNP